MVQTGVPRQRQVRSAWVLCLAILGATQVHAGLIVSDQDRALAIRAYGNRLSLQIGCSERIEGCSWSFRGGQLMDDASGMAIRPAHDGGHGVALVLGRCEGQDASCRWVYSGGQFRNAADRSLSIGVQGGARRGSELILRNDCRPGLPDCSWVIR